MPACCGSGTACSCRIQAGTGISVSGTGTAADPFVLSADTHFVAQDNARFNMTVSGSGTVGSPYQVSVDYAATSKLDDVPDVNAPAPTNGQVLAWNTGTSRWVPVAPTTAASGSVTHDASLTGDGSAGTPLAVLMAAARFLALDGANGIGISDTGMRQLVRHFTDDAQRASTPPAATLNALSMLDTNPGILYYSDGSLWKPLPPPWNDLQGPAFLEISGPYDGVSRRTKITATISGTTDASGNMDILGGTGAAMQASPGGVLSCQFQETGAQAFAAVLFPNVTKVSARIYRLTDGTPWASATFSGIVTAWTY